MTNVIEVNEFMVNFPIHKYVRDMVGIHPATEGNTYLTTDLNTNTKKFYTVYFHCHGHAFEDQDKIRKLLKKAFKIGAKELEYEAPYHLRYRLMPEKYNEIKVILDMMGY